MACWCLGLEPTTNLVTNIWKFHFLNRVHLMFEEPEAELHFTFVSEANWSNFAFLKSSGRSQTPTTTAFGSLTNCGSSESSRGSQISSSPSRVESFQPTDVSWPLAGAAILYFLVKVFKFRLAIGYFEETTSKIWSGTATDNIITRWIKNCPLWRVEL